MKAVLKILIKGYIYAVSPFIGKNCRFQPTCSAYAIESIEKYGSIKGTWLALKRLAKCHPWNKSDPIDPVS